MALTISKEPQLRTPGYNDQWIIATSNQTAISDFYYQVEVLVNSVSVSTQKFFKRLDNTLHFNAKEIVKNYLSNSFVPTDVIIVEAVNHSVQVDVIITEYYSAALHTADKDTTTYHAFNGCLKSLDFDSYNYTAYTITGGLLGGNSLNRFDSVHETTTDCFIDFYGNSVTKIEFITFADTYTFNMPFGYSSNKIYRFNCGKQTLIDLGDAYFEGDMETIKLYNGATLLHTYTYTISDICTKFTHYVIYFLDRSGRISFKSFELLNTKKFNKASNSVRVSKGATSLSYTHETFEVSNQTTYTHLLNTNWITEAQSTLLDELIDSPLAWLYDGTNYMPIKITDTSYEYKKYENESLFNLLVNVEYSINETRQRAI